MRLVDRETGAEVPRWKQFIGRVTGWRLFGGEKYMWTSLPPKSPNK